MTWQLFAFYFAGGAAIWILLRSVLRAARRRSCSVCLKRHDPSELCPPPRTRIVYPRWPS